MRNFSNLKNYPEKKHFCVCSLSMVASELSTQVLSEGDQVLSVVFQLTCN